MKKVFLIIGVIVSLLTIGRALAADVEVQINGKMISFDDTTAQIINDRTMVPFRKIFNELGVTNDNISWDDTTKTIIAKKDAVEIQLQIGSNMAEKRVNGQTQKIALDSAPVIRNDRTLVPLRFIAESLEKTVGWDAVNRTAVIIDFDYFMNAIRDKSNAISTFLLADTSHETVTITRKYFDDTDSTKNNTAVITADLLESESNGVRKQNATISFSGTNGLMKEIQSEGWSTIQYENTYYDGYFTTHALNEGLKKVYGQDSLKFYEKSLGYEGSFHDSFATLFKTISEVKDNNITINTFQTIKDDFDYLLKQLNSTTNGVTTGNINGDAIDITYFDPTKLDGVLYDSAINRAFSFINSQIFHFDISWQELCYDYPRMNMTITANNLTLNIELHLANDYNERVEYVININK